MNTYDLKELFDALSTARIFAGAELDCMDIGEVSDGYHTFNQLYHQRAVLFATIINLNKDKAWKSFKHFDGNYCFDSNGEWFIVGVDTPKGSYTYHYSKEYWNMFNCKELECGKEWDGHTEEDVTRLLSLELDLKTWHWIPVNEELPKENKTVIASTKYGVYPEAKYTKEYGWEWAYESGADYWEELEDVTAWMPLPTRFKPQESEGKKNE